MTREDIIRMAQDAGAVSKDGYQRVLQGDWFIGKFASLVAAVEREACALECDKTYHQHIGDGFGEVRYGIAACAAAIRARGQQ